MALPFLSVSGASTSGGSRSNTTPPRCRLMVFLTKSLDWRANGVVLLHTCRASDQESHISPGQLGKVAVTVALHIPRRYKCQPEIKPAWLSRKLVATFVAASGRRRRLLGGRKQRHSLSVKSSQQGGGRKTSISFPSSCDPICSDSERGHDDDDDDRA